MARTPHHQAPEEALLWDENLNGQIRFWRPHTTGAEILYYTIDVVNARVVHVEQYV